MFEAGFLEMLLIAVIGLLVVGPERLPKVARQIGTWIGKLRRFVSTTRQDLERELHADEMRNMLIMQEEKIRELQSSIKENTDSIKANLEQDASQLRDTLDDAKNAAQGKETSSHDQASTEQSSPNPTSSQMVLDMPNNQPSANNNVVLDKAKSSSTNNDNISQTDKPSSPTPPTN
jgi:sec-independent protein translocase protein TatB